MKMISIDPGTTTCGVAIFFIDDITFEIKNITSFTITIDNAIPLEFRLYKLYETLHKIILEVGPMHYVHESSFMNRFRPQAYGPIYAAIFMIRKAFIDYNSTSGLFTYPPKSIKAVVSTGNADKDDMFKAVSSIQELSKFLTGMESEHAIDAMAIGYVHLLNIRQQPELLFI